MRRIRLIVSYDGTNYCGWQIQENAVTVEGTHSERRHCQRGKHLKSRQLLESPDGCSVVSADGGGVPEAVCWKANQQDSDH